MDSDHDNQKIIQFMVNDIDWHQPPFSFHMIEQFQIQESSQLNSTLFILQDLHF